MAVAVGAHGNEHQETQQRPQPIPALSTRYIDHQPKKQVQVKTMNSQNYFKATRKQNEAKQNKAGLPAPQGNWKLGRVGRGGPGRSPHSMWYLKAPIRL